MHFTSPDPRFPPGVILVRSNPSGVYFLVRVAQEEASLAALAVSFPGMPVQILQRNVEYLLVRLVRESPEGAAEPEALPTLWSVALSPPRERAPATPVEPPVEPAGEPSKES